MFTRTSRYYGIPLGQLQDIDGEPTVFYVRRRFIPMYDPSPIIANHLVVAGDRLDNITARYLGDPELYWKVCDTNLVMNPPDATSVLGRTLRVPLPQGR